MEELSTHDPGATEINWRDLEHRETAALFCHDGCLNGFMNTLGHSNRAFNSEDFTFLNKARSAVVMNHHESLVGRMEKLVVEMPSMLDLPIE